MEWIDYTVLENTDFIVGEDDFGDLKIRSTAEKDNFYYFYSQSNRRLIKRFILRRGPQVDYVCEVKLIKKDDRFTPRLVFSIRDKK
mgnify:CR=1 FL=1